MMRRSNLWFITLLLVFLAGCQYLIDSTGPEVNITDPVGDTVQAGNITVTASVSDTDSGLKSARILIDGSVIGEVQTYPRDEEGRYQTLSDTVSESIASLATGTYTITVLAVNGFGVETTATKEIEVVAETAGPGGETDQEAPTAEWISPNEGDIVTGVVPLAVFASDDIGVVRVEFYAGSTLLATDANAPFSFDWDTTDPTIGRADGPVTLEARAFDAVGRVGSAAINIQVLNSGVPPTLDLRQPSEGADVGIQFTVTAEITRQGEDFTWVDDAGRHLWARIYDQVGNLVVEGYMTSDGTDAGTEPLDNEDFVARRDFNLDSFLGELPLDRFTVIVEGTVNVNGSDVRLAQKAEFDVVLETNLPPALILFAPVNADAAGTEPTFGDTLSIVGRVTDDSGSIHSVEVRMVCDACGPGGAAQNKLLFYAQDYDLFSTGVIPLDGTPFVQNATEWALRVIAIDSADLSLRNIIQVEVDVDRAANFGVFSGAWADPVTEPPTGNIDPSAARWTYNFAAPLGTEAEAIAAVTLDGEVQEVIKQTLPVGATDFTYRRTFGDTDIGSWSIDLVLQDSATGVQVTTNSPSVGVSQIN